MAYVFKGMLFSLTFILVILNAFLSLSAGIFVTESGESLFFPVLGGVYDNNSIYSDVNAMNLDYNTYNDDFLSDTLPTTSQSNTLYAQVNYMAVWNYIYSTFFAVQILSAYVFGSLGMPLIGIFISTIFAIIQVIGLFALGLEIFSIFRGGGGL